MRAWTRLALALLAFGSTASFANAAWRAAEGIDVATGKPSVLLIGDLDQNTALYARCVDGHAELFLDGFDGGDFDIAPVGPVNLVITTETGKTWSSEARYAREKSGYITTTWLTRETISPAVAELAAAKSAISVTIEFVDTGDVSVWDTDAKGSTAAGKAFLAACPQTSFSGLPGVAPQPSQPDPVPEPSPEPASELRVANWRLDDTGAIPRLVGQLDDDHVLTFNCDPSAAVVLIHNDGANTSPVTGKSLLLSVAVDNGTPWNVPVRVERIAPGYLAFSQIAEDVGHIQFMDDLLAAKTRIDVRLDDAEVGQGIAWSVSPAGIPNLALEYFVACLVAAPVDKLAPTAAPASSAASWSFNVQPDGQGSEFARLLGRLDGDRYLYAVCDSQKAATLALIGQGLPYEVGDVGLNLYVSIDGKERLSTGEFFSMDGAQGVSYAGADDLEPIFRDLASAQSAVSLRIVDYSDGSDATWPAVGLDGVGASAVAFVDYCYAGGTATVALTPETTWTFSQSSADVAAGYRGVMSGQAPNGTILRITCSLDAANWTIGLIGPVVDTGPAHLAINIEDLTWDFAAAPTADPGVVASGSDLAELVPVLSLPRENVLVEIVRGDTRMPYSFSAGNPASETALEMFRKCYALG